MTVDKTRVGKARRTEVMERTKQRINLENRDPQDLDISLENPSGWRTTAWNVGNMNTTWGKSVLPRMLSARNVTK